MFEWISNSLKLRSEDSKKKEKPNDEIEERKKMLSSVHGKYDVEDFFVYGASSYAEKRNIYMTKNMDELIDTIKQEINSQPLLSRTISNMTGKISNTNYSFQGANKAKVKQVESKFAEILKNSNYNDKVFLKEMLMNLVKFSNAFMLSFENSEKKMETVLIIQNRGWHVHKSIGTCYAQEFNFEPKTGSTGKRYINNKNVWHYTFNKETDEIFGMPVWMSVIPFLKKYNYLLSSSIDSYSDQSIQRIIYEIGVTKSGTVKKVNVDTHNRIVKLLEYTDDDVITDTPVNANVISKTFTSPDKILDVLEGQIVAGLYTSKGQLGSTSSGRQDAETQDENTLITAEDFLNELEVQLNQTLIKRICQDLFGNNLEDNEVLIKFEKRFDLKERIEKHAIFLFQSGVISLDEARKMCGLENEDFEIGKTFFKLYQETEMQGQVESANNPKNQHTSGTGTTKKTKKDFKSKKRY